MSDIHAATEEPDPRLWLEAIDSDEALEWVRAQNELTMERHASGDAFEAHVERLLVILQSDDKIPFVQKRDLLRTCGMTGASGQIGKCKHVASVVERRDRSYVDVAVCRRQQDRNACGFQGFPRIEGKRERLNVGTHANLEEQMNVQGANAHTINNQLAARSRASQGAPASGADRAMAFDAAAVNGESLALLDGRARAHHEASWNDASHAMPQDDAVAAFQQQFARVAGDEQAFHALMQQAFGSNYDRVAAEAIRQQTLTGDFGWMPRIEVVDSATLADQSGTQGGGSAMAAYDSANDRILLSRELLAGDPARALAILGEEVGHALDARLNTTDSAGDEGDIFSRLLAGDDLSDVELTALRAEDDSGTIVVDGESIDVEYGWLSDAWDSVTDFVGDTVDSVVDVVTDTVESVGDFVSDTVQSAGDAINDGIEWVNDNVVTPGLEALGPAGEFVNDHLVQPGIGLITDGVDIVTNTVDTIVDTTTHAIVGGVNISGNLLVGDIQGAWNSTIQLGQNLWNDVGGWVVETGALSLHALGTYLNGTFGLSETRGLTPDEEAYLRTIYGNSVDYSSIRIQQGGIENLIGMDPHAVGNDIYLPDSSFNPDGTLTPAGLELLSHEVGHTWQFQNDGAGYVSEALFSYINDRPAAYDYEAALDVLLPWDDMTPDQQAEFARIIGMAIANDPLSTGQLTAEGINEAISDDHSVGEPDRPDITEAEFQYFEQIYQNLLTGEV